MNIWLTNSEREIMDLLWDTKRALSATEIVEISKDRSWKKSYIHILVNSLLEKEMIKVDGFVKSNKNYARTFSPAISETEYSVAQITEKKGFGEKSVPAIVSQLLLKVKSEETLNEIQEELDKRKKKISK